MEALGFQEVTDMKDMYHIDNNVGNAEFVGLLWCLLFCLKTKPCLFAFYKENGGKCMLHSKTFHFKDPAYSETGWTAYSTKDVNGRCPHDFTFYRELHVCYKIFEGSSQNLYNFATLVEPVCANIGASLFRVDSSEKQEFMNHVLAGATAELVCIQGKNYMVQNTFTFDDGTPLNYTNWCLAQPDRHPTPGTIAMRTAQGFCWDDMTIPALHTCSIVCEWM